MAELFCASEVIDLLDVTMEEEPCLEGSDDDLELQLSDDEERLVHNNNVKLEIYNIIINNNNKGA